MFDVRLAGGHLYGKQLFTWLSLVVSLIASFCPFFPLNVLDEIWDLIESVSEGFLTYSSNQPLEFICSLGITIISVAVGASSAKGAMRENICFVHCLTRQCYKA